MFETVIYFIEDLLCRLGFDAMVYSYVPFPPFPSTLKPYIYVESHSKIKHSYLTTLKTQVEFPKIIILFGEIM